jgi:hypothetical protein
MLQRCVCTGTPAWTNPDAALIALCAEHIVNKATFNSGIEPEGDGPYWDPLYDTSP